MPLFGFECEECHHQHELLVRADAEPECPKCGSRKMTKQMSVVARHGSKRLNATPPCGAGMCCGMSDSCAMN